VVKYVQNIGKGVMEYLWKCMTQQPETASEKGEHGLADAAYYCLWSAAGADVDGSVVDAVYPYLENGYRSKNWRERDAALMAIFCVMDSEGGADRMVLVCEQFLRDFAPQVFGSTSSS